MMGYGLLLFHGVDICYAYQFSMSESIGNTLCDNRVDSEMYASALFTIFLII